MYDAHNRGAVTDNTYMLHITPHVAPAQPNKKPITLLLLLYLERDSLLGYLPESLYTYTNKNVSIKALLKLYFILALSLDIERTLLYTTSVMKPDKITCNNCGKQIAKGKWCSDKCRMANKRKGEQNSNPNTNKPEQILPEQPKSNKLRDSLTKTDKTFYDRAVRDFKGDSYYNFTNDIQEKECARCNAKFKTGLALLKYCSYDHYSRSLSGLSK